MVRFWRWGTGSVRQEEIIASQRQKLEQETVVVQNALFDADHDNKVAEQKLVEAQAVSNEAKSLARQIRHEEELNGLALIFRRGLTGGQP